MEDIETKPLLSVSSSVVHGYVGNRSIVFPLQTLGWDVDAINTTDFLNHPGYGKFKGRKVEPERLEELFDGLKDIQADQYKMMLVGYCPTSDLLEVIYNHIEQLKSANPESVVVVVDPVLGDNGKLYVSAECVPVHKRFWRKGLVDLATPNQFELELLTGMKVDSWQAAAQALRMVDALYDVPNVVLLSVVINGVMAAVGYSRESYFSTEEPLKENNRPNTKDSPSSKEYTPPKKNAPPLPEEDGTSLPREKEASLPKEDMGKKDLGCLKKPMNAYIFFCMDRRRANPDVRYSANMLGEMRKSASHEEMKPFEKLAAADRHRYYKAKTECLGVSIVEIDEIGCSFNGCGDVFSALLAHEFYENDKKLTGEVISSVMAKMSKILRISYELEKRKTGKEPTHVRDIALVALRHVFTERDVGAENAQPDIHSFKIKLESGLDEELADAVKSEEILKGVAGIKLEPSA